VGTQGAGDASKAQIIRTVLLPTGWTAEPSLRRTTSTADATAGPTSASKSDGPRSASPLRLASPLGRTGSTDSPTRTSAVAAAAHRSHLGGDAVTVPLRPEPAPTFTPVEALVVDDSTLHYRLSTTIPLIPTDANVHQSGFYAEDMPTSDEVLQLLNKFTMVAEDPVYAENEKILAQMLLRFTHDGKPISFEELQLLNPDLLPEDKEQLDRVAFHCFVRRVVKWLITPCEENKGLLLPLASIQARTLQLIEAGIITWREAFDRDGLFGVFYCDERTNAAYVHSHSTGADSTGQHGHAKHHYHTHFRHHNHNHLTATLHSKGSGPNVLSLHHTTSSKHVPPLQALRNKAKHVNALYQKYVVELQKNNFLPVIQYWKQHTTGATVPSYKLLYAELARCYGGETDDPTDLGVLCEGVRKGDTALCELLQKLQS
jgi:hypothetical protein